MKTTIKTIDGGRIVAEPLPENRVQLTIDAGGMFATVELTQDQAGALMFGLEVAAEVAESITQREGYFERVQAECIARYKAAREAQGA